MKIMIYRTVEYKNGELHYANFALRNIAESTYTASIDAIVSDLSKLKSPEQQIYLMSLFDQARRVGVQKKMAEIDEFAYFEEQNAQNHEFLYEKGYPFK